jgi:hypothetical protein
MLGVVSISLLCHVYWGFTHSTLRFGCILTNGVCIAQEIYSIILLYPYDVPSMVSGGMSDNNTG